MKDERYWLLLDLIAKQPCTTASSDAIREIMSRMRSSKRMKKAKKIYGF